MDNFRGYLFCWELKFVSTTVFILKKLFKITKIKNLNEKKIRISKLIQRNKL